MYPGQLQLMNLFALFVKKLKTILFLIAPIFVRILIHFGQIWTRKLQTAVLQMVRQISAFIKNLDQDSKALLLLGCLPLPFDSMTLTVITRLVASAIGKIYKLRTERLRELEAPWLRK